MSALFDKLSREAPGWHRRFASIAEAAEHCGVWPAYQAWLSTDQGLAYVNLGRGKAGKIDLAWLKL